MKSKFKSPQEAKLALDKINANLSQLHSVFSSLFPNSIKEDQTGKKLIILAKTRVTGTINIDKIDDIYELAKIQRKTNRRKYLEELFDDLINIGLLQKTEKENILCITTKGRILLDCLSDYINRNNDEEISYTINRNSNYYEYVKIEVTADGKKANWKWTWKLVNKNEEPIDKANIGISSGSSINNDLNFWHSDNIKRYEHTVDDNTRKRINLYFKEVIKKNQSIEYSYSYDWNSIYKINQTPWEFFMSLRTYPAKQVIIIFKLKNGIGIKEETQTVDYNILNKDKSTATGEYMITPLITRDFEDHKEVEWNIINMPTNIEIRLAWEPLIN